MKTLSLLCAAAVAFVSSVSSAREITSLEERQRILRALVRMVNGQDNLKPVYDGQVENEFCRMDFRSGTSGTYGLLTVNRNVVMFDRPEANEYFRMTVDDRAAQPVLTMEFRTSAELKVGTEHLLLEVTTSADQMQVLNIQFTHSIAKMVNSGPLTSPEETVGLNAVKNIACR